MIFTLYALLGLAIVSTEVYRFSRYRSVDALTLFNGAYFLFFVFVPLNVVTLGEAAVRQKYVYQKFGYGDETTAMVLLACYLLFVVGYAVKKSTVRKAISCHSFESDQDGDCSASLHKKATQISITFLLIGFIGLSYHTVLMGGVVEVIKNAPYVRSGEFGLEGEWLFLRQLSVLVSTALILFWAVYDTKKKVSIVDTGLMLIMIIVFVFYALSTNGRREFWYLVILCFLVSFVAGNGFKFRQLALFIFGFVLWFVPITFNSFEAFAPVTNAAAPVTNAAAPVANAAIATSYFKYVYLNTIQGLADTFMHFVGMQHASLWQFGFLADIAEIPLEFVPSSLFGFERSRGFFGDTSEFFLGHPLAQGLSSEEPPGLHGYLLVNFGYIGMFLLFFLLGLIYKVLDNVLRPVRSNDAVAWLIYWWVFFMFLEFFREGALILVLKPRASWWLAIGLLIYAKWNFENKRHQFQLESASRA